MWIGTLVGLDRYDGIEFRNYKVTRPRSLQYVNPIIEDSLGQIWSGEILLQYIPEYDKQQINWMYIDDTLRWADGINDIIIGPDNKLYLARENKIYTRTIDSRDSVIHELFMNIRSQDIERISTIKFDAAGNLWLGTDRGLFCYDPIKKIIISFDGIKYPEQRYIHDLLFDAGGKLWIVFTNMVVQIDVELNRTVNYLVPGVEYPILTTIFQSRDGTIWLVQMSRIILPG
jgi:ligand-binding sensor domain-containing protein